MWTPNVELNMNNNKNALVELMGDKHEPFTNTLVIAEGVGLPHKTVIKLLKSHSDLEYFRELKSLKSPTKGRPIDMYWLSEEQATLLVMLMKNTPVVLEFKTKLVKEFSRMKKALQSLAVQKQNQSYIEERAKSKEMRKECTDVIKKFVEYAKAQGSKSADKYYMAISNMELAGFFLMEQRYPRARELMNRNQLHLIEMADRAIGIALEEGMNKGLPYKECFELAKSRIQMIANAFPREQLLVPQLTII